jgi:hypothetical protein
MANLSEIAAQLQTALADSQKAHKALEDAKAALSPLEVIAEQADDTVNALMKQYQSATGVSAPATTTKRAGGAGKKRGPRSLAAVLMTAATRLLGEEHAAGKQKKQAVNAALDRIALLAAGRKETVTEEIKAAVNAKADSIWGKK